MEEGLRSGVECCMYFRAKTDGETDDGGAGRTSNDATSCTKRSVLVGHLYIKRGVG